MSRITSRSFIPCVKRYELLAVYDQQRAAAIVNYHWQRQRNEIIQQLRFTNPPTILQTSYEQLETLSVQLVLAEQYRDEAIESLRQRLLETNWCIETGLLFIELPKGNYGGVGRRTILVRNPLDENDQLFRKYAIIPRGVAMAIKNHAGQVDWASARFCELAARPLSMIIGKGSHEIWPDKYGEIIFGHDLEVVNRRKSILYPESLWVQNRLRTRFSIRFPLELRETRVDQIAVIGFDPFSAMFVA